MTQPDNRTSCIIWTVAGEEFDVRMLSNANDILRDLDKFASDAKLYIDERGAELWNGEGQLLVEAIDITNAITDATFGLTFGVAESPDLTLTVEFRRGIPYQLWAAD